MNKLITGKSPEAFNEQIEQHTAEGWTSIMGYEVTAVSSNHVIYSAIIFKPDPKPKREVFNEPPQLTNALLEVVIERQNQIANLRDANNDSKHHPSGELRAAARKLTNKVAPKMADKPKTFSPESWSKLIKHPHHKRLIIAAALLCAEADRLEHPAAAKA